jgi:hypothetical protein
MMKWILLINFAVTLYMTGVIWFVQVVHYPLFGKVGAADYVAYHSEHVRRTGYVVALPMLLELASALALSFRPPESLSPELLWIGVGLVGALWLSTGLLQVPRHRVLGGGYVQDAHRVLVISNWLRTVLWSVRAGLMTFLLWQLRA